MRYDKLENIAKTEYDKKGCLLELRQRVTVLSGVSF
jgi:hypothetical protein